VDEDSAGERPPDTSGHDILRELALLLAGFEEDRQTAGELADLLEKERLDNPLDVEVERVAIRRLAARANLRRLVRFLHSPAVAAWHPGIIEHGLSRHLRDLFDSLGEVDAGAPAALFKPPPGPKVASPAEEEFRGKVAAVVGLLLDAGATLKGRVA
jgi:hypothetical protein